MTAEIAIMNCEAIAMAADSAVTFGPRGSQKALPSANKIFALSKYEPVGVMVYGNGSFMGVPWETVIKMYRSQLARQHYATLSEYGAHFVHYLCSERRFFPADCQETYLRADLHGWLAELLLTKMNERAKPLIGSGRPLSAAEKQHIVESVIDEYLEHWSKAASADRWTDQDTLGFRLKYGAVISQAIQERFGPLTPSAEMVTKLQEIAFLSFTRFSDKIWAPRRTGVVIAGFGRDDIYPQLVSYEADGVYNDRLQYRTTKEHGVTRNDNACIIPFAQEDMVSTFVEGVDPLYEQTVEALMGAILEQLPGLLIDAVGNLDDSEKQQWREKIRQIPNIQEFYQFQQKLRADREKRSVAPILTVIGQLPKDELAAVAESLVNLTSLKRRVSFGIETVGGPVDVALISKGDGLIWVRRKHYFSKDLNQHFFANYYREDRDGNE